MPVGAVARGQRLAPGSTTVLRLTVRALHHGVDGRVRQGGLRGLDAARGDARSGQRGEEAAAHWWGCRRLDSHGR
jgi:hypothetical protein